MNYDSIIIGPEAVNYRPRRSFPVNRLYLALPVRGLDLTLYYFSHRARQRFENYTDLKETLACVPDRPVFSSFSSRNCPCHICFSESLFLLSFLTDGWKSDLSLWPQLIGSHDH